MFSQSKKLSIYHLENILIEYLIITNLFYLETFKKYTRYHFIFSQQDTAVVKSSITNLEGKTALKIPKGTKFLTSAKLWALN